MGRGSSSRRARQCRRRRRHKEKERWRREMRAKPSSRRRVVAKRPPNSKGEFLPLEKVKGLKIAAKKFLRDHAFYKARLNLELQVFEAMNEAGTIIIRGGLSPLKWQQVYK